MENKNNSPEELDPTNENENNESLQTDSEENNNNESNSNGKSKKRYYKGNNRKLANLRRTKSLKKQKQTRLISEIETLKADLKRGYFIVETEEGQTRHKPLDVADKKVISSKISELDYESFLLTFEIGDIDENIRDLASVKKSNITDKKNKVRRSKQEDDLVDRVGRELNKASTNDGAEVISAIQQQVKSGKKNEAYDSLKSFLSEQVKPVAKKLDKSEQLEKKVLDRVLEKLSKAQA
jgi:hypothetical protein